MQKTAFQQIWHFIWHDDSIWSWIVNLILAFVIIKFLFYPGLGLLLGSAQPLVAVVSSSMEHDGNFDAWWNSDAVCSNKKCTQEQFYSQYNISKDEFSNFKFKNGFNKGDVMVLTSANEINQGDTIVFIANDGRPIIHRVISLEPLETKGDHNVAQIISPAFTEKNVNEERVIGKASLRIPFIGYIKIFFTWLLSLFGVYIP